jgi:hypothetical protein
LFEAGYSKDSPTRGALMAKSRRALIGFGAVALTSTATLAGACAAAGAATSSGSPVTSGGASSTTSTTLPATLTGLKNLAHTEITHRVASLTTAVNRAKTAKGLGAGRGPLESYLGQDIGPLQQLDTKIQNDGTLEQATADDGTIFTDFRVYRLVLPAAHVAATASRVADTAVPGFQAVVARAERHSTSTNRSTLSPLVDNLKSQIATASNATNGLAGTVLGDTPAQWNANNSLLAPAQASIAQAVGATKQGRKDVRQLREVLVPGGVHHARTGHHKKHGAGHPTSTSTSTSTTS